MMQRPLRFVVLGLLALAFFGGPSVIRFYTDWLWFGEVGYQPVFLTMLRAQATLFAATFAVAALWLAFNFRMALAAQSEVDEVLPIRR